MPDKPDFQMKKRKRLREELQIQWNILFDHFEPEFHLYIIGHNFKFCENSVVNPFLAVSQPVQIFHSTIAHSKVNGCDSSRESLLHRNTGIVLSGASLADWSLDDASTTT